MWTKLVVSSGTWKFKGNLLLPTLPNNDLRDSKRHIPWCPACACPHCKESTLQYPENKNSSFSQEAPEPFLSMTRAPHRHLTTLSCNGRAETEPELWLQIRNVLRGRGRPQLCRGPGTRLSTSQSRAANISTSDRDIIIIGRNSLRLTGNYVTLRNYFTQIFGGTAILVIIIYETSHSPDNPIT